ncbi:MAG: ATP-binding protein [Alphaproteobacteria bacterium]
MKIKRKILVSLLALFIFFTSATLISTAYIEQTTEELLRLIKLHQIENLRRNLVSSIQTVQSDLYTVHTPLARNLDAIVENVATLDESAEKCSSCHHKPSIHDQLQKTLSLIHDYKDALSYYITASANQERITHIKSDAAMIGEQLLRQTEAMSSSASETLVSRTAKALTDINYARIVILMILGSSLLLGVIVSAKLTGAITKPIKKLVEATKIIASGSLGYTISDKDDSEFGELASNFNAMSIALKDDYNRLQDANQELHTLIAERERVEEQLRQAQKMEAIGTLAGGIAHDFNNILMTMINHAEFAANALGDNNSAHYHLEKVLTGGRRARDLIRQIILFSRQSPEERKPVRLDLLVNEVMALIRASLPSNIDIRENLNPDAGTVVADTTQLHQVLMNLGANAERAMREKGGVLEVRVDGVEVDENLAAANPELRTGPYVLLSVRDTGHGIEPEVIKRIFEPFFTTNDVGQGAGMGLAVVHGIVAKHGGAVTVESTPGVGTVFNIYLPRVDHKPEHEQPVEEPVPRGTERVLYVDDEPDLVDVVQEGLQDLGYEVLGKTNGTEALETFRAMPDRFDLIITDQTMPDITGDALAREFRRIRPDIPIILCTGFSHVVDGDNAEAMGIDAFCLKPLRAREISLTIRRVMAQRLNFPLQDSAKLIA